MPKASGPQRWRRRRLVDLNVGGADTASLLSVRSENQIVRRLRRQFERDSAHHCHDAHHGKSRTAFPEYAPTEDVDSSRSRSAAIVTSTAVFTLATAA